MENTRRNRRHCTGYPYRGSMFVAYVASFSVWFRSKVKTEERNFRVLAAREMVARSLTLVPRNCAETFATHVTMFATFRFVNKLLPTKFSTKFVCRLQCSGPLDFLINYCRRSFKPSSFASYSQISQQLYSLSISKCWLATAKFDKLCEQNWFEIQIRTGIQSRIRPSIWRLSDVMPVACITVVSVYF